MSSAPSPHTRNGAKERRLDRNIDIWNMRKEGWTQADIAEHFGITQQAVSVILAEAYKERSEPVLQQLKAAAADRWDGLERVAREILEAEHPLVQGGKVVYDVIVDEDEQEHIGDRLLDDGPRLAALDRIAKIETARAALFGYNAEQKVNLSGGVKYEIVGISNEDMR